MTYFFFPLVHFLAYHVDIICSLVKGRKIQHIEKSITVKFESPKPRLQRKGKTHEHRLEQISRGSMMSKVNLFALKDKINIWEGREGRVVNRKTDWWV